MWVIWWTRQHIPMLFSDGFSCPQTGAYTYITGVREGHLTFSALVKVGIHIPEVFAR
jgi:hypothetical protein